VQGILRNISLRYRVILNRMRLSALQEYRREVHERLRQAVVPPKSSDHGESEPAESACEKDRSAAASDLTHLTETFAQYAKAWRKELGSLRDRIDLIERDYQDSSYLTRLPRIPRKVEEEARLHFDEELKRVAAQLLQLDPGRTVITPGHSLRALATCWEEEDPGIWQELAPSTLAAIPQEILEYFELLVRRVQTTLYAKHYEPMSVNDLLAKMPCHEVRWSASAKPADVQERLESFQDETREKAKREVLISELFQQAVAPLPVSGIQIQGYFWLSPVGSEEDDYLLDDPSLHRQTERHRDFTEDQAAAILVAHSRDVRSSDLLEASGSIYRRLLKRGLRGHKNQPEFVPIPESLTKDETDEC